MVETTKKKHDSITARLPNIILLFQILIVNRSLCQRLYRKRGLEITDRMICAGKFNFK